MIKIEVTDCKVETSREDTMPTGEKRWIKYIYLDLVDKTDGKNIHIPEWYYAIACNQNYLDNPIRPEDLENREYFTIQNNFDLQSILEDARKKVEAIQTQTWEEAFKYLGEHYLKDD